MQIALILLALVVVVLLLVIQSLTSNKYLKRIKTPFDDKIRLYQPKKDGMYADWFGSLNRPIQEMCFEKNKMLSFLEDNIDWFEQKNIFFVEFLFQKDGNIFVGRAFPSSFDLWVVPVSHFGFFNVWRRVFYQSHLVVPAD